MKLSWKEILIIAVLAALATGLSFFSSLNVLGPKEPNGIISVDCWWCPVGWPFPFAHTRLGQIFFHPLPFLGDLIFYSILILIGWLVLKLIFQKIKK